MSQCHCRNRTGFHHSLWLKQSPMGKNKICTIWYCIYNSYYLYPWGYVHFILAHIQYILVDLHHISFPIKGNVTPRSCFIAQYGKKYIFNINWPRFTAINIKGTCCAFSHRFFIFTIKIHYCHNYKLIAKFNFVFSVLKHIIFNNSMEKFCKSIKYTTIRVNL